MTETHSALKIFCRTGAVALAIGLFAPLALAQEQQRLFSGPLSFNADTQGDLLPAPTCRLRLAGRVEILQAGVRLRADEVTITQRLRGDSCGSAVQLEAVGNVFYVTTEQSVRADRASYDLDGEQAVFTGSVIAVQGEDVSTAERMEIDLETGAVSMTGRVRGVVFPDESETP